MLKAMLMLRLYIPTLKAQLSLTAKEEASITIDDTII